ncbi:Zinc transporter ZupT [Candidatus Anstonella stagnisolia]|nr:Zinc transporter ZupT [Candidatus Anstonella stagnisolia]
MDNFLYALASVFIVSLISLVGVLLFFFKSKISHETLLILVSFAAGSMLAAAFFDLLPEALAGAPKAAPFFVFGGIILFLFIESFMHWHHCQISKCNVYSKKSVGYMNLVGDGVHNFLDGIIIASAYLVSVPVGIVTTIAIIAHEIPQELGDFAVLLNAGFRKNTALLYNFLSATTAIIGTLAGFFFLSSFEGLIPYATALAAGSLIYISTSDLFPEISKHHDIRHLALQLFFVLVGAGIICLIAAILPA